MANLCKQIIKICLVITSSHISGGYSFFYFNETDGPNDTRPAPYINNAIPVIVSLDNVVF